MNLKNPWNGWMPRERLILALFFFCTIKKLKGLLSHSHLSICSLFTFWKKAWPWWKRYRELRTEYFIYSLQSHMGQGYQCSSHGTGKGSRGDFRIEGLSTIFAAGRVCSALSPHPQWLTAGNAFTLELSPSIRLSVAGGMMWKVGSAVQSHMKLLLPSFVRNRLNVMT